MWNVESKLKVLASVCSKFKSITVKEQRTWAKWTYCLENSLIIITDILECHKLSYSEMIILERIIVLLLNLPIDYNIDFNPNSPKQNKVKNLLNNIEIQFEILKKLQQEKLNDREKYNNFDEWVTEKNIIKLDDLKHDIKYLVSYRNPVYENEYSLYMDFRDVLLNRRSSNNDKLYILEVMDDVQKSLLLDIDLGLVEVNMQVLELLSMATLVKNNLEINLSLSKNETIEELKGDLAKTVNEKTLKMCLLRDYS